MTKASFLTINTDAPLRESTVGSTLRDAAGTWPRSTGLVATTVAGGIRRWSFDDLCADAERLALALLTRFSPGEQVAIWAPNVGETFIVQLGTALAGITLVPVPLALRHQELRHLLGQSESVGIFLVPTHRGVPMADTLEEVRPELPSLREVIDLPTWDGFLASSTDTASLPTVEERRPVSVMYTSGSTGLPKGAVLHHQGVTNASRFVSERMGVGPGDVWLNFMPLSYVAGSAISALAALAAGATQVLCDFEPGAAWSLIESERCSALIAGPTMYRMLLDSPARTSTDASSLRTAASGGSKMAPELANAFEASTGARLSVIYGLTEACGIALATGVNDPDDVRTTTIGRPLPHVEVQVVDVESGDVVARGEPGELRIRGYQVMNGYFDLPEATAEAIDVEGWLHTGDVATIDEGGYVRVTGRLKEIINRGGRKLAPGEIETVLQSHPAVEMAAVLGVPDERWGEEIAAFVKLAPGAIVDEEALAHWCRTRLAPYKTPRRWVFVDELPLTSAGKVRKFLLREQLVETVGRTGA
jgi:fatty-acyl-CoA synthase